MPLRVSVRKRVGSGFKGRLGLGVGVGVVGVHLVGDAGVDHGEGDGEVEGVEGGLVPG